MLGEILGDHGCPVRFQIARCVHHNVVPLVPQREGDHVDWYKVSAADTEIEAARDNVNQPALCHDVDVDLRVHAQKWQDEPGEHLPRCCRKRIDAQRARRRGLLGTRNRHRFMNVSHEVVYHFGDDLGGIYGLVSGVAVNAAPQIDAPQLIHMGVPGSWTGEDSYLIRQPRRLDSTLFAPRERAALSWTEVLTKLPDLGIPDEIYDRVRTQLSEKEISDLRSAVLVINSWNRLNVGFKTVPCSRQNVRPR